MLEIPDENIMLHINFGTALSQFKSEGSSTCLAIVLLNHQPSITAVLVHSPLAVAASHALAPINPAQRAASVL